MIVLLYIVHVLVCVFLILVVLLQQGKGADLSVFGGGSTQTAFGARGATTFLHKLTVASFIVFVLTTLAIGIPQLVGSASVMRGATRGKTGVPSQSLPGKQAPSKQAPGKPAAGKAAPVGAPPAAPPAGRPPQAPPAPRPGTPGVPR